MASVHPGLHPAVNGCTAGVLSPSHASSSPAGSSVSTPTPASTPVFTARRQDLFPLPPVPPPAPHDHHVRGGRARQRRRRREFLRQRTNDAIAALNWLWASGLLRDPNRAATAPQLAAIDYISSLVRQAYRRGVFPTLGELSTVVTPGTTSSFYQGPLKPDFLLLRADRAALPPPGTGATVDVLDHLPSSLADRLRSPTGGLLRESLPLEEINAIPVVFGVQPGEYGPLVRRMDRSGLLVFFESKEDIVINGLFGVHKDRDHDRVILDGRRGNMCFQDPDPVELPNPGVFGELILPQGQQLFVGTSDSDNMFHRLRLPSWMWRFFALPGVSSRAAGLPGPDRIVYPALQSCPMGFSWAVVIAQSVHVSLLDQTPGHQIATRLRRGGPIVIGPAMHAAYIDDYTALGTDYKLVRDNLFAAADVQRQGGLPPKPSKFQPPEPEDPAPVHSLGLAFGRDGLVRPIAENTRGALLATYAILRRGACTGLQLHRVLGMWTWNALLCRCALSTMFACYGFIARTGRRRGFLPRGVRQELQALIGLVPLLSVSLGSPISSRVYATDASFWGAGVCYEDIGEHGVLNALEAASGSLAPECLLRALVDRPWTTAVSSPWGRRQHINELEGQASLLGLQHLLRTQGFWGRRVVFVSDSRVIVGALRKGRSSSWGVNRVCRRMAALQLATGVLPTWLWCPTDVNPADNPSRHRRG